jgi:hypothetical protein
MSIFKPHLIIIAKGRRVQGTIRVTPSAVIDVQTIFQNKNLVEISTNVSLFIKVKRLNSFLICAEPHQTCTLCLTLHAPRFELPTHLCIHYHHFELHTPLLSLRIPLHSIRCSPYILVHCSSYTSEIPTL